MWNLSALGQCNIAPPVNQDPSIEYSLSGAKGPAFSARYPGLGDAIVVVEVKKGKK